MWSSSDTYFDLAKSAADATEYYKDQKDHEVEKLFWSQFSAPERPLLLNEQTAEWAKLHRLSGLDMSSIVDHLWPEGPRPNRGSVLEEYHVLVTCIPIVRIMLFEL